MVWWMKWQIFTPLFLLQFLNLFWYILIWRVLWRYVLSFVSYTSIWMAHVERTVPSRAARSRMLDLTMRGRTAMTMTMTPA
jgi:hypothetical protein